MLDYVSDEKYVQHNLAFPHGKEAIRGFFADKETGIDVTIHRAFTEGDFVVLHSTYAGAWNDNQPQVAFDVFRFEGGKAVEHWDNLLEVRGKNASGHTQTDGPTEVTDLDKTAQNKSVVARLMEECFLGGDYSKIAEMISPKKYIQHNPDASDGLEGFDAFIKYLTENHIEMTYTKCHHVIAQGDLVITLAEGTFGGRDVAYYDLFRLEDGMVVEHWDIVADIPPRSAWANDNGKF